ncbi:hypothetical protein BDM02DRAFT_1353851 [Thelephora ganbajun]|uniref:Uncharacterized protein n=1 Tax=Thelephora ganbajun TaxID=370292 RepID=A0ACB6ZLF1_THEGA|nr:hypothetical protein BDM02DRAFT_1353851 [Thelephora ganbajun]
MQACCIGLKELTSIALLAYDFFADALLTGLFLWPVMRSSFRSTRVRHLAVCTLWSTLITLTTSCANILVLTLMHGRQLGWICFGSCGVDVTINALVIYWVTSKYSDQHDRTPTAPNFISPSKSENPEPTGTAPTRSSKAVFKLGHSRKHSPAGHPSMEVNFVWNLLPRSNTPSLSFYRSKSLRIPSGLMNTVDHQSMSRSMSCKKCTPFNKSVPTEYERIVLLIPINRPPLQ